MAFSRSSSSIHFSILKIYLSWLLHPACTWPSRHFMAVLCRTSNFCHHKSSMSKYSHPSSTKQGNKKWSGTFVLIHFFLTILTATDRQSHVGQPPQPTGRLIDSQWKWSLKSKTLKTILLINLIQGTSHHQHQAVSLLKHLKLYRKYSREHIDSNWLSS